MTVYRRQPSNLAAPSLHTHGFDDVDVPGDWVEQAACAHASPGLFYPAKGVGSGPAKAICAGCPVIDQCLTFALGHEHTSTVFGVWGGLTARQRRKLIVQQGKGTCQLPGCDLPANGAGSARCCSREHSLRMKYRRAAQQRTAS